MARNKDWTLGELDIELHLCPNISTSFVKGERNMPWSEEVSSVSHARVYLGIPHDYLSCSSAKVVLPG